MSRTVEAEIEALQSMTIAELAEQYQRLHGRPCRTRHRAYLIRKNAWRIQANAEGDLTERARRRAEELADDREVRVMAPRTTIEPPQDGEAASVSRRAPAGEQDDPRLPSPGSAIVRQYKGRTIRVVVLPDGEGFEHDGERYRTLSAVAKHVTGTHLNGFRFFRLGAQR